MTMEGPFTVVIFVATFSTVLAANKTCGGKSIDDLFDKTKTYNYSDHTSGIRTCLQCPPGMRRIIDEHCFNSSSVDHCKCCESNYFKNSYDRSISCEACQTRCPYRNAIKKAECTRFQDILCECDKGFYKYQDDCLKHSVCKLGEGVVELGNITKDTVCRPCEKGVTFNDKESTTDSCQPCTKCNPGDVQVSCDVTTNTVCRKCEDCVYPREGPNVGNIVLGVILGVFIGGTLFAIICFSRKYKCRKKRQDDQAAAPAPTENEEDMTEMITHGAGN